MKPIYLYIENFTSHKESEINFSGFSTALIVGKLDNNSLVSNGVGKTSIFRSIEYVLFNQTRDPITDKDLLLEDLILEGAKKCKVIFDFSIGDDIYRVIRARTDKGVADLSFYKRSPISDERNAHTSEVDKELWLDISSRRTQDTEADLIKTIKMNYKAFINTSHFMQFDFKSSLAATTPAHRKTILKEVLDLIVYSKLEKIAKAASDNILKEIEKHQNAISMFGDPTNEITILEQNLKTLEIDIQNTSDKIFSIKQQFNLTNSTREELLSELSVLESQVATSMSKRNGLLLDIQKINTSLTEYSQKRKNITSEAKHLINALESYKNDSAELSKIDFTQIELIQNKIQTLTIEATTLRSQIATYNDSLVELQIPLPADGTCKHCRQVLTKEHLENCKKDIEQKIEIAKEKIKNNKSKIQDILREQNVLQAQLATLQKSLHNYNDIKQKIDIYQKDIIDKKKLYTEYTALIDNFNSELNTKNDELNKTKLEVARSSEEQINNLKQQINHNKQNLDKLTSEININSDINNNHNAKKAVILHSIQEKQNNITKKIEIEQIIRSLENTYATYPYVIEAFSSTGIPSVIINNILDDLQTETNNLLAQLRPGLQLAFEIEKTNTNGTKDDTLDITYFLNNKPRKYGQLSGAQKVFIMFALKLGLSFLLKKIMGTQLNLLMIDEIDQPMDDASVDALADIIKHFQKDFTILIITHRKRLQDKFNTAILVEQNQDMISRAKVVSSW